MGYYKDLYNKCEAENIKAWEVLTVHEVDAYLSEYNFNDEDYETVCGFVYDWVMDSAAAPADICIAVDNGLNNGEFTVDDIRNDYEKVRTVINSYL